MIVMFPFINVIILMLKCVVTHGLMASPCPYSYDNLKETLYDSNRDHCYYVFRKYVVYSVAVEFCDGLNLDLLELDTETEWLWYCAETSCFAQTWLGIKKSGPRWYWRVSNRSIAGNDGRFDGSGSYAYIESATKWRRNNGAGSYRVVCEQRDVTMMTGVTTDVSKTTGFTTDGALTHDVTSTDAGAVVTTELVTEPPMICISFVDQGRHYPDPTSCYHYYVCLGPMNLVRKQCHQSTYWDQSKKACDRKANVVCDIPDPTPPSDHTPSEFSCDYRLVGTYPDPTSCSRYLQCDTSGNKHVVDCGAGLYYNPAVYACDWATNVPSCTAEGVPIASPTTATTTIAAAFGNPNNPANEGTQGIQFSSFRRFTSGHYNVTESITTGTLLECIKECARVGESLCVKVAYYPGILAPCKRITPATSGAGSDVDCGDVRCYKRDLDNV